MPDLEIKPNGTPPIQFSVMLKNRAGALSSLVRLLRGDHIEVIGLSVQDSRDACVVRLVLSDPDNAMRIFMEKGIPHTTSEIAVIGLTETGGGLARALDTLRAAETNVDFAYSLMSHPEGKSLMALHLEDTHFGMSVLHNAGFKVYYEEDLVR
ncbi:acetolactate synthase [Verrucomicrobiaceae bacterium R5-34]|uniref:Acetolactate synthase n=1 Tax=Oceaniferula flava TaxID=2800421 RepID=A0AAE2SER8_9BACT|nr:acetolactate synthase [Oceaniferula flavus]MBK1831063.1 acetolactate synthase [Verrucomicrobiaceae bacterium R5-34]MBK1855579.1 acetolactate synthase [Oceaniferula flavus]MBM1136885.1 acetolactate synthase [Oceaniferula flavus]